MRETALEGLGLGPRALVVEALRKAALGDANDYARAAAAKGLGRVHAEGAFEALDGLLARESHGDVVRAAALEGLAALGDRRGIEKAAGFLPYRWGKGGTHKLRRVALDTLIALSPDDRDVHARLVTLLSDRYHNMRVWAAEACGKLKVRAPSRAREERRRRLAPGRPERGQGGAGADQEAVARRLRVLRGSDPAEH